MEELLPKVRSAFSSAFGIEPHAVTIETTPADIAAWDSMGHVTLASCLESIFELSFDVDDLMEMEDVKGICSIVQSKLAQVQNVQLQGAKA
jgi:acyl carrier protein